MSIYSYQEIEIKCHNYDIANVLTSNIMWKFYLAESLMLNVFKYVVIKESRDKFVVKSILNLPLRVDHVEIAL